MVRNEDHNSYVSFSHSATPVLEDGEGARWSAMQLCYE